MKNIKNDIDGDGMSDVHTVSKERDSFANSFKIQEGHMTEHLFRLVKKFEAKCDELLPVGEECGSGVPVETRNGFLGFIKMHQEYREEAIARLDSVISRLDDLI